MKVDKKFQIVRHWSNDELKKHAHLFKGEVVNISGWKDIDKQGKTYRDYFSQASNYYISNHSTDKKGFQDNSDEILLDLEQEVPEELKDRFDVVFNHTVLEHVYYFHKAIDNLCLMSKDVIITVVPFLQQMHGYDYEGGYGDFWRFTPLALRKLFEERGYKAMYLSYSEHKLSSVYIYGVFSKQPQKWESHFKDPIKYMLEENNAHTYVGHMAILNEKATTLQRVKRKLFGLFKS